MRPIKFRAWLKKRKVMGKILTIHLNENPIILAMKDGGVGGITWFDLNNENAVVMQYTGLKDKNGVEIYEHSELDGIYEVIFKDMRYSLRHIRDNDIIDLHDYWRGKNGEIEVTREYTKV